MASQTLFIFKVDNFSFFFFYLDKYRSIYPGDSSNDGNTAHSKQDAIREGQSWCQGLRGRSSPAWNRVVVRSSQHKLVYHCFQIYIRHC